MKYALFAFVISLTALCEFAGAQPIDISGTWALDEKRSGSAGQEGFISPQVWTVKQSPVAIVVERRHGDKTLPFTYLVFDKAPSAKSDPAVLSPGGDGHRAFRDGARIVLETLQNIQGKTVTTREMLSLSADGSELQVERILEVEHGYMMKGAQNYNVVKDVFVRK